MSQLLLSAFKELGQHLGKKLDEVVSAVRNTPQKIELDLGQSSRQLESAAEKLSALADIFKTNEKSKDLGAVKESLVKMAGELGKAANALERGASNSSKEDFARLHSEMVILTEAVRGIKLEEQEIDFSPLTDVSTILLAIQGAVESKSTDGIETKLEKILEYLKQIKVELPQSFKLDSGQLDRIVNASGYGGGGGGGSSPMAARMTMANVDMASANTQYSYTFPKNTVGFYMKVRAQNAKFTFAWVTGKMPTSGDGTAYMTTTQNFLQSRPDVSFSEKTIYFQSDVASQVMEIESYQF
jgi:hypothetical protein